MKKLIKDLEEWFKGRHAWQQDAARRFVQNGKLVDKDIIELVKICKKEAGITVGTEDAPTPLGMPPGVLHKEEHSHHLHLLSISDLIGINALHPKSPLVFGDASLAIVYGANGTGKSGYVRALKHACGAKYPGTLYPDIFADPKPASQGCKFKYKIDGMVKELNWIIKDGINHELSSIELYDSVCADVYIDEENELTYEPGILSLFAMLTSVCDKVATAIDHEGFALVSKKQLMPQELLATSSGAWYEKLNYGTSKNQIEEHCKWDAEDQEKLESINNRLATGDPKTKAASLRKAKDHVEKLKEILTQYSNALSPEQCNKYLNVKNDSQLKRKIATEDAVKVFSGALLSGVGSEGWKALWEKARDYSEKEVYKGILFPNTNESSRCVLCHQVLDDEARKRFISFEEFIKGALEKDACTAEGLFAALQNSIDEMPKQEDLVLRLDSAGVTSESERESVLALRKTLELRKKALGQAEYGAKFDEISGLEIIKVLEGKAEQLENQAKIYDEDSKKDNRLELQKQSQEYQARKWLSGQRTVMESEVDLLGRKRLLSLARNLTDTHALSLKKSALAEELITAAFIKRFDAEVKVLGAGRTGVELVKTKTQKGHAFHAIRLKHNKTDIPTSEILSEGEFRIISLAAFLADVEGHANKASFVFDDPISSLDQDYEEATARRLVELSKARQVIVFTHRLSMLALLEGEASKNGLVPNVIGLEREPWGAGEPIGPPLQAQKPKKTINLLIARVKEARKILADKGKQEYDWIAKGICSEIRITLERLIENDLLADVIQRFRRSITTQGKLHKLAKITASDCKYMDDLMTKYSRYEHSQPGEAPVPLPDPDELEVDLTALAKWRDEFEKRSLS